MLPNEDQRAFWSEQVGDIWVAQAPALDAAFQPVLDAVLEAADLAPGQTVVDVGCGAGTSSFRAAERVGAEGAVCGVDVSEPLLAAAREDPRLSDTVFFVGVDAQTHSFGEQLFDRLISRFGVMFFDDTARAFANMSRWLKPGGRMAFATWGAIPENPFFTLPAAVSKAHFGPVPKSDPDAPGPFALRDREKTCAMLAAAGLEDVAVTVDRSPLTPVGSVQDLAALMCEIGPAQRGLVEYRADAEARAAFVSKLETALEAFITPQGLRIPAEINIFTATKAS